MDGFSEKLKTGILPDFASKFITVKGPVLFSSLKISKKTACSSSRKTVSEEFSGKRFSLLFSGKAKIKNSAEERQKTKPIEPNSKFRIISLS
jgi:hypothetical protein